MSKWAVVILLSIPTVSAWPRDQTQHELSQIQLGWTSNSSDIRPTDKDLSHRACPTHKNGVHPSHQTCWTSRAPSSPRSAGKAIKRADFTPSDVGVFTDFSLNTRMHWCRPTCLGCIPQARSQQPESSRWHPYRWISASLVSSSPRPVHKVGKHADL